jgi:hypothetical protein
MICCGKPGAALRVEPLAQTSKEIRNVLVRRVFALALFALIAACSSSGGQPPLTSTVTAPLAPELRHAKARLVIKVPPRKRARHERGARYVSPATASLKYQIDSQPIQTVAITPSNPNCQVVGPISYLQCSISLILAPGRHTFAFSTFDANGALLSADTDVTYMVKAGQANDIPVILGGVAASLAIVPLTPGVTGSQNSGFNVYGNSPQRFSIVPVDSDDNVILGPGEPQPVAQSTPSGMVLSSPSPASPNIWTLTSTYQATNPTVPSSATLTVSATPVPDSGGSLVSANAQLALYQPWIYVNSCTSACTITAYDEQGNEKTLPGGSFPNLPQAIGAMLYDSNNQHIYVSGISNSAVTAYDDMGAQQVLVSGAFADVAVPFGMAFDSNKDWIYVVDTGPGMLTAYDEQGNQQTLSGGWLNADGPFGAAFDPQHNWIYVTSSANTVRVYDEQGNQQTTSGSFNGFTNTPYHIAYDGLNDSFYVTSKSSSILAFDDQGNSQTLKGNWSGLALAEGIAYDPYDGWLYVADNGSNTVRVYDQQGNAQTITGTFPGLANISDVIVVP